MKRSQTRNRSKRALGAALAGILAGASLSLGCGQGSDAATPEGGAGGTQANGCNGPNGCNGGMAEPGDEHAGAAADANGCNGPNGCNGEAPDAE